MFFLSLLVFSVCIWPLPWWIIIVISLAFGLRGKNESRAAAEVAAAAGLAWMVFIFFKDGQFRGLISERLAGAFQLPSPYLLFLVVFVLGFLTSFLVYRAGASINDLLKRKAIS